MGAGSPKAGRGPPATAASGRLRGPAKPRTLRRLGSRNSGDGETPSARKRGTSLTCRRTCTSRVGTERARKVVSRHGARHAATAAASNPLRRRCDRCPTRTATRMMGSRGPHYGEHWEQRLAFPKPARGQPRGTHPTVLAPAQTLGVRRGSPRGPEWREQRDTQAVYEGSQGAHRVFHKCRSAQRAECRGRPFLHSRGGHGRAGVGGFFGKERPLSGLAGYFPGVSRPCTGSFPRTAGVFAAPGGDAVASHTTNRTCGGREIEVAGSKTSGTRVRARLHGTRLSAAHVACDSSRRARRGTRWDGAAG